MSGPVTSPEVISLTADQRSAYIDFCLDRGDAPVKPEFLELVRNQGVAACRPLAKILGITELPEERKRDRDSENDKPRKRARGQNKNRHCNISQVKALGQGQLCQTIAASNATSCLKGESCPQSHDRMKAASLKDETSPLDEFECSNFKRFGWCRYGLNCRFREEHVAEGFNVNKDGSQVIFEQLSSINSDVLNELSETVKSALKGRTYKFNIKPEFAKSCSFKPNVDLDSLKADKENNPKVQTEGDVVSFQKNNTEKQHEQETKHEEDCRFNSLILEGSVITDDKSHDMSAAIIKKRIEVFESGKLMLAPLTTLGNIPFRRLCVGLGAEVTMSEMAMASSIVEGRWGELALLRRHPSEKYFGIQLASGQPTVLAQCCSMLEEEASFDFVDLNSACPLEPLHKKMAGCILMNRPQLLSKLTCAMRQHILSSPISVKLRMSYDDKWNAHKLIPMLHANGVDAFLVHGRTSRQRYSRKANWDYLASCKEACPTAAIVGNRTSMTIHLVIGNGDVMAWEDYHQRKDSYGLNNVLIGRGALIKPWIFTEIKEQRLWDISASERFDLLKDFVKFGFETWGTDTKGIENTRRFTHRYIPVGLLERVPQQINWRSQAFCGRSDLETLLSSSEVKDWIKISELLLGQVPTDFKFIPKHKSNS